MASGTLRFRVKSKSIGPSAYVFDYFTGNRKNEKVSFGIEAGLTFKADGFYAIANDEDLRALFMSHGHLDHVGGYALNVGAGNRMPIVYGSPLAMEFLKSHYRKVVSPGSPNPLLHPMLPKEVCNVGHGVKITAYSMSHSIPQSYGFLIETPAGTVWFPGDYKMTRNQPCGPSTDFNALRRIGHKGGVDVAIAESTRTYEDGRTREESEVLNDILDIMERHPEAEDVIVPLLSTSLERMATLADAGRRLDMPILYQGGMLEEGVHNMRAVRIKLEQIYPGVKVAPGKSLYGQDLAKQHRRCFRPCTGGNGNQGSVFQRFVEEEVPNIPRCPGKTMIIFSASLIEDINMDIIVPFIERLRSEGFIVEFAHESGHARWEDQKEMLELVNPRTVVTVHGSDEGRAANTKRLEEAGYHTINPEVGTVFEVIPGQGAVVVGQEKVSYLDCTCTGSEIVTLPNGGTFFRNLFDYKRVDSMDDLLRTESDIILPPEKKIIVPGLDLSRGPK